MTSDTLSATEPVLVTGGTGKTGRRLAERLAERQVPFRIASRGADTPFDWEDSSTWDAALEGMGAAYLCYSPDLAMPGAAETVEAFAARAMEKGVKRLVLLSGRGEESAREAESRVMQAGAEWTILRASWFAQNFSESFILEVVKAGELALPVGDIPEPFIDVEDIADVALTCLTESGHAGKLYELTGPRLLTFGQAVHEIAEATGRDIRFRQIEIGQFVALLEDHQVPQPLIDLMIELFTQVLDGRNASTTDCVRQVLGRAPRDLSDYVRRTAQSDVWNPEAIPAA